MKAIEAVPWRVWKQPDSYHVVDSIGQDLALVEDQEVAALLCAAPALLAACERIDRLYPADSILAEVIQVREALKKARGE